MHGSVGTSASEDKLLSSRESHPGVIPDDPGLSRIKTFDRAQRIMFRELLRSLVERGLDISQGVLVNDDVFNLSSRSVER